MYNGTRLELWCRSCAKRCVAESIAAWTAPKICIFQRHQEPESSSSRFQKQQAFPHSLRFDGRSSRCSRFFAICSGRIAHTFLICTRVFTHCNASPCRDPPPLITQPCSFCPPQERILSISSPENSFSPSQSDSPSRTLCIKGWGCPTGKATLKEDCMTILYVSEEPKECKGNFKLKD